MQLIRLYNVGYKYPSYNVGVFENLRELINCLGELSGLLCYVYFKII
jgi:hypothetical protein